MRESRYHASRDSTYHRDLRSDDTPPNPNLRNSSASAAGRDEDWGHPSRNSTGQRWEDRGRREDRVHPSRPLSDGQRRDRSRVTSVPSNQRGRRFSPAADEFVGIDFEHVEDMRTYKWIWRTICGNFSNCDPEPPEVNGANAYIFFGGRADTLEALKMISQLEYKKEKKSWQRLTPILLVPMNTEEIKWLKDGARRASAEEPSHRHLPREERPMDEPGQLCILCEADQGVFTRKRKSKCKAAIYPNVLQIKNQEPRLLALLGRNQEVVL